MIYTMMSQKVSAKTVTAMMNTMAVKASASLSKVVYRARRSKETVEVACTALEGQQNRCSTCSVHLEELASQRQV